MEVQDIAKRQKVWLLCNGFREDVSNVEIRRTHDSSDHVSLACPSQTAAILGVGQGAGYMESFMQLFMIQLVPFQMGYFNPSRMGIG